MNAFRKAVGSNGNAYILMKDKVFNTLPLSKIIFVSFKTTANICLQKHIHYLLAFYSAGSEASYNTRKIREPIYFHLEIIL